MKNTKDILKNLLLLLPSPSPSPPELAVEETVTSPKAAIVLLETAVFPLCRVKV